MACTIFYKGEIKKDCRNAFFQLIAENFLNRHGGTANSKHAQINKFFRQHHPESWGFDADSTGEFEISLLISILHFCGFQYAGTEQ